MHPFGADHLLAMVAVGLWSASALPGHRTWCGPATFLLALVFSAALGASGVRLPGLEQAIALSVALWGALLVVSARPLPLPLGLGLVAVGASLHGLAHGAEAPTSGFAGYAAGFLLTSAALHLAGVALGRGIRRRWAVHAGTAFACLGSLLGLAGGLLWGQVGA